MQVVCVGSFIYIYMPRNVNDFLALAALFAPACVCVCAIENVDDDVVSREKVVCSQRVKRLKFCRRKGSAVVESNPAHEKRQCLRSPELAV